MHLQGHDPREYLSPVEVECGVGSTRLGIPQAPSAQGEEKSTGGVTRRLAFETTGVADDLHERTVDWTSEPAVMNVEASVVEKDVEVGCTAIRLGRRPVDPAKSKPGTSQKGMTLRPVRRYRRPRPRRRAAAYGRPGVAGPRNQQFGDTIRVPRRDVGGV